MISPAIRPPRMAPGKRADAADHHHHEGLNQDVVADTRRQRHHRRVDDSGKARRHCADAEHDHEDAVDIDAERIDHAGVLDAGPHDHADPGAIEHDEQRDSATAMMPTTASR